MRLPWSRRPTHGAEIRILRLEPGDTVVLGIKERLGASAAADIDARLRREFPGHRVIVLHGGLELSIIREAPHRLGFPPNPPIGVGAHLASRVGGR